MSTPTAEATITTSWPAGFPYDKPGIGGFAVREVAAPAEATFAWARRIDLHTDFYPGLRGVRKLGGAWPVIEKDTKLSFLLGAVFVPMVKVILCDEEQLTFAWGSNLPGMRACHQFTIKPIDDNSCLIRSEELWVGPVARAMAPAAAIIQKVQTDWAEAIAAAASARPGGPPTA